MLETIRQFAEEQLVASGEASEVRTAHARYFAGREADILALWDSPRQREAYAWFTTELANLRAAFRWAADHGDLDTAAAIAICATFLGFLVEQYEPVAWAEELIEPARAVDHRRLAQLYVMARSATRAGRVDDGGRLPRRQPAVIDSGRFDELPFGVASLARNGATAMPVSPSGPLSGAAARSAAESGRHSYLHPRIPGHGTGHRGWLRRGDGGLGRA